MKTLTTNQNENHVDIHDLCIDGDYIQLKNLLQSNQIENLNEYKLFLCQKSQEQFQRLNNKNNQNDDEMDENYFDYRSPLFCAIIHNHLSCIQLLIQYGANQNQLRFFFFKF